MTIMPIIIDSTKECIIQAGKKFCEDTTVAPREFAILTLLALAWLSAIMYCLIEARNPVLAFLIGILPLLIMLFL